jgi:hypothetical protein
MKGSKNLQLPLMDSRVFFKKYVDIIESLMDKKSKLRKREAEVLAELLYHDYLKRGIENEADRSMIIFDISTRRKIQESLGSDKRPLSNAIIQQALGGLRKKGYVKGITLGSIVKVVPKDGKYKLIFSFKMVE